MMVMKIKTEDVVDVADMPQVQTAHHVRASSFASSILLGGAMKQRQPPSDSSALPQTSAYAPTLLNLRSLATATADTLVGARGTGNKLEGKRSHLAALAVRALFLLALVAFLRALLGLEALPLPISLGPFSGPVTPSADYLPSHQHVLRTPRAAHDHFDHGHQLAVDTDGHVSFAYDFDYSVLFDGRISAKWPWAARKAGILQPLARDRDSGPARGVPDLTAKSTEPNAGAGVKDDGPALGEGSAVLPLRVHLPGEEALHGGGGERRHKRGRGVRYSY